MTEQAEDSESETVIKDNILKVEMPPPATTKVIKRINARASKHTCMACNQSFAQHTRLKYHIRSSHYNLKSKVPTFLKKNVNDVWFEKVLNTDNVAEMTKIADNKLLVRKMEANETFRKNDDSEEVDVSELYPTAYRKEKIECDECHVLLMRKDFKKHFKEKH